MFFQYLSPTAPYWLTADMHDQFFLRPLMDKQVEWRTPWRWILGRCVHDWSGSGSGSAWISIGWALWIRFRIDKKAGNGSAVNAMRIHNTDLSNESPNDRIQEAKKTFYCLTSQHGRHQPHHPLGPSPANLGRLPVRFHTSTQLSLVPILARVNSLANQINIGSLVKGKQDARERITWADSTYTKRKTD